MDAFAVLAEATKRAAVYQLAGKRVDAGKLNTALYEVLKDHLVETMAEWKAATEAHMPEAWLRELLNAQAHTLALEAIASLKGD